MANINKKYFVEIPNLDGYLINKKGDVYSEKSGKLLKANNGTIEFYVDGRKKKFNVAHLVLLTFRGNPDNASRVRYKNGDRNDASLGNVEWSTPTKHRATSPKSDCVSTSPRQKEISAEIKALEKQMKKLKREKATLSKTNEMATTVKNIAIIRVTELARPSKPSVKFAPVSVPKITINIKRMLNKLKKILLIVI